VWALRETVGFAEGAARSISNGLSCRWIGRARATAAGSRIDVVVNCVGVLQDGPGSDTATVHCDSSRGCCWRFATAAAPSGCAYLDSRHARDHRPPQAHKREAERLIADPRCVSAILRPGFVVAPAAYGGSAMVRSLAAFPFVSGRRASHAIPAGRHEPGTSLPPSPGCRRAIWRGERRDMELMQEQPVTLGGVVEQFRRSVRHR